MAAMFQQHAPISDGYYTRLLLAKASGCDETRTLGTKVKDIRR